MNPCDTTCGDGITAGTETCDDGGTTPGDGCDASCMTEVATCDNGSLDSLPEECDDGNNISGDGCHGCLLEAGWSCPTANVPCTSTCGDGIEVGTEGCDDGNTTDGDGCDSSCVVEHGFDCSSNTNPCDYTCGDGDKAGTYEQCDDGDADDTNGCSNTCILASGFNCPPLGGACSTTCGDSIEAGAEACDDGNTTPGDGCDATCTTEEPGFTCPTQGSPCDPICPDGLLRGNEECDDNNSVDNDGCSNTCIKAPGYDCPSEGTLCNTVCGDMIVAGTETCDDGNTSDGDGCTNDCLTVETYYECPPLGGICNAICGDATIIGDEECDDGNTDEGDGCDSNCLIEIPITTTPTILEIGVQKENTEITLKLDEELDPETQLEFNIDLLNTKNGKVADDANVIIKSYKIVGNEVILEVEIDGKVIGFGSEMLKIQMLNLTDDYQTTGIKQMMSAPVKDDNVDAIGQTVQAAIVASIVTSVIGKIVAGSSFEMLFAFINALQVIHFMPIILCYLPTVTLQLFQYVALANMDNVILQEAFFFLIEEELIDDQDEPVNYRYDNQGFGGTLLLGNSADTLGFLVISTVCILFVAVVGTLVQKSPNCLAKKLKNSKDDLRWNYFIRMVQELILEMSLASFINIQYYKPDVGGPTQATASLIMSYAIVSILPAMAIAFTVTLYRQRKDLNKVENRYGSMYCEFKLSKNLDILFYPLFIVRRLAYAAILVFLPIPALQIGLSLFIFMVCLVHLHLSKPYKPESKLNFLSIFNESICILILGTFFFYPEPNRDEMVQDSGWVHVGLVCLMVVVNFGLIVWATYTALRAKCREKCGKKDNKGKIYALKEESPTKMTDPNSTLAKLDKNQSTVGGDIDF